MYFKRLSFFIMLLLAGTIFIVQYACKKTSRYENLQPRDIPFKLSKIKSENDEFSIFRHIITFNTDTVLNASVEYWDENNPRKILRSATSSNTAKHRIKLTQLRPETEYGYHIIVNDNKHYSESETQYFKTSYIPVWLDLYYTPNENTVDVKGKILIYKRKSPGVLVMLNSKGEVEWYNVFNNFLKAAIYSRNNTFLCILSDPGYVTAYGNHLIELNFNGDTLHHFITGEKPYDKIFHHDILLDSQNNIMVLTLENRKYDLSEIGGSKTDSVAGDGIQVFSPQGKKIWEWTVFDVADPKSDPDILKEKEDWLHANSLCYDRDSNLLISFYKSNQIWKVNSKTGNLMWRLGENGDFTFIDGFAFSGQHSIHINRFGHLMMFDNGLKDGISRAVSYEIDEKDMTARTVINAPLPKNLHSPRMGSAYLFDNNKILQCSSNNNKVIATDLNGKELWSFDTGGLTYRAVYIEN